LSPWTLIACVGPDATDPTGRLDPLEPALRWSAAVESVAIVSWTAPAGATSTVELDRGDGFAPYGPPSTAPEVEIPLLGLAAGETASWRAVSEGPGGRLESAVGTLTIPDAPEGVPRLVIDRSEPGAQAPTGFLLGTTSSEVGSPDGEGWTVIWDGDGDPVWWWPRETGHLTASVSFGATRTGSGGDGAVPTVVWDDYDLTTPALTASGLRVGLDGSEPVEFPLPAGHHAALEPTPDEIVWISRDVRPSATPGAWVTADRVLRAPIGATEQPEELIGLYEALYGGVYTPPCDHPLIPYAYDGYEPVYEWSHLNSLVWLPEQDAFLVHLRWVDTVLLVDAGTGLIRWTLGGPYGEFTDPAGGPLWDGVGTTPLSHAHLSQAWDGGLVAFDNGSHRQPQVSALVELAWDEQARTATEVFRWEDPQGRFVGVLGDAKKLPGGTVLGSWSVLGELNEVAPDGREVWHATTSPLRAVGRIQWVGDLYGGAP
jgi:hypothetical protein